MGGEKSKSQSLIKLIMLLADVFLEFQKYAGLEEKQG